MSGSAIEALLEESRRFPPLPEFTAQANATPQIYAQAERDYVEFWAQWARQLEWSKPFTVALEWNEPFARWFSDGELNVSVNCLDRHVRAGRGDKIAYYFEGEPGDRRTITYSELLADVCRFANGLRSLGVRRGDRVAIYMPMIPELPVAMLACARIGAAHSVIFGGFSPESIVDRANDAQCVALITADYGWRRGNKIPLKRNCDIAMEATPSIEHCIVARRVGDDVFMHEGRDYWWDEIVAGAAGAVRSRADECGGSSLSALHERDDGQAEGHQTYQRGLSHARNDDAQLVFDLKEERDIFWCTADIGWVTGHSYIVYGPLANGATGVIYEGTPDFPDKDRFWEIVERYGVTILYTAPTAIRTFMKWGPQYPARHDLSSLRLLGTVGEPINPEAWIWYREWIGGNRTPVVDTWWQTETGGIMISPLPGVSTLYPGSATKPLPGVGADIVNDAASRFRWVAAATPC